MRNASFLVTGLVTNKKGFATSDRLVRSQVLYPAELQARSVETFRLKSRRI